MTTSRHDCTHGRFSAHVGVQRLTVNNQQVLVQADGSFNTAVELAAGPNTLSTVSTDNAGNQKTILISSHDLDHVTDVCSRIVILEKGKVIRDEAKTESTLAELEEFFTGVKVEKSFMEE